eukprot:TRINITY_DN8723_c0_g1_i1.p1 TRINITY_DN8723_c0_g1~~TRINITY_DN8723_c0_g1_i1.p1  ORF type:complete len:710 (+),score=283.38 TRINITY_DN8723_c0_g1_i1:68-2197(+)
MPSHEEYFGNFYEAEFKSLCPDDKALLVLRGLPALDPSKVEKLRAKVTRDFKLKSTETLVFPTNEAGMSLSIAFLEMSSVERAKALGTEWRLDKAHLVKIMNFSDAKDLLEHPDEYEEPQLESTRVPFVNENLYEYVCDTDVDGKSSLAREQYMVVNDKNAYSIHRHGYQIDKEYSEAEIAKVVKKEGGGSTGWVQWSPLGSYLVTLNAKGVHLYGGNDFALKGSFARTEASLFSISPKEKYLATYCAKGQVDIWDVLSGKNVKKFKSVNVTLPLKLYLWSADERFLMRLADNKIFIHDGENDLKLVKADPDKSLSIEVDGLKCDTWDSVRQREITLPVAWSPTDNLISYWVPEKGKAPARVSIVEVVVKKVEGKPDDITFVDRGSRHMTGVKKVHMHWHPQGDFLACRVEREVKEAKGKTVVSAYEIFRVRGGGEWPVEKLENVSDPIVAFDWEPRGHRFAFVHGVKQAEHAVSFYTMGGRERGTLKLIRTLNHKEVNTVYWSPRGHHAVLAGSQQPFNGKVIEFWDVDALEKASHKQKPEPLATVDHNMLSGVRWDPSGRYVCTFVDCAEWQGISDGHGFVLWTFQGKRIYERKEKNMRMFLWRPRPASHLTDKEHRDIQKSKKKWSEEYRRADELLATQIEREERQKRIKEKQAFSVRRAEIAAAMKAAKQRREEEWTASGATYPFAQKGYVWKEGVVSCRLRRAF